MKTIRYSAIVLFLSLAGSIYAQDIKLTMSAPKVVAVGENFRLTFTVNTEPDNFSPPELENIMVLAGPNTSSQTSATIINGKMSRQVDVTYTYIVRAEKEGQITIPPATISVKRKEYKSNSLSIDVIKGNNSAPTQQQQQTNVNTGGEKFLIRLIPSKKELYLGEHITASIKIFTKQNIRDVEDLELPPFTGFFKQDIENTGQVQLTQENVGGETYYTANYRQIMLYPQKTGDITIDEATMTAILQDFRLYRATVKTKPVTIKVKPLPATSDVYFTGAVGKFTIESKIDKTKTVTNDAITLKVTIKGTGNLRLIDDLNIDFPPTIETYDPKVNNDLRNTTSGTFGTKTFEYLLIPRHAGEYRIPPIRFTFFNPGTKSYQTVSTKEYNLEIEKSNDPEGMMITGLSKEDVKFIGEDIQFIKQDEIDLKPIDKYFFGTIAFYGAYLLALIMFGLIILLQRNRIKRNANVALVKNRKANKLAHKRLKTAQNFLKSNDKENFYNETLKALWGYLSDKLSIPVADLNHDNARETFKSMSVPDDINNNFFELVHNCEFARFAPVSGEHQMENDYKQAVEVISKLDQNLR